MVAKGVAKGAAKGVVEGVERLLEVGVSWLRWRGDPVKFVNAKWSCGRLRNGGVRDMADIKVLQQILPALPV